MRTRENPTAGGAELEPVPTKITVRALSCDAKIIGTLVGGCRVRVTHRDSGEILAQGLHLGGSGSTERILEQPPQRYGMRFDSEGTARFRAEIPLRDATPVEIVVEGPLAHPHALQKASLSTWLIPGQDVDGDGFVLQLHGFIVDLLTPHATDVIRSQEEVHLQAGVRLL